MKKILLLITGICLFISCGGIDNYDEAEGVVEGGIYDLTTNELIPAQAPNGARIRLYESNSTQPIDFWCMTDGTFYNKRVFAGDYRIIPEGPFIVTTSDTIRIHVPAKQKIDFNVEPFLRVKASAALNGSSATVKFTIAKSDKWDGALSQYAVLYSWTKSIDINNYTSRESVNISADDEENFLGKELTFTVDKIDTSRPVFIRVAARTSGTNYYNYSEILQLK